MSIAATPKVMSANLLTNGTVAYLDGKGNWVGSLAAARILAAKDEESIALAAAERAVGDNLVLDPVLVELAQTADGWRAKHLRDRIRLTGPTVKEMTAREMTPRS